MLQLGELESPQDLETKLTHPSRESSALGRRITRFLLLFDFLTTAPQAVA